MNKKLLLILIIAIIAAVCVATADSRSMRRRRRSSCSRKCESAGRSRCRNITNGATRCRSRSRRRCRRRCRRRRRRRRRTRRRRTRRTKRRRTVRSGRSCAVKCRNAERKVHCVRMCRVKRAFKGKKRTTKRRRTRRKTVVKTVGSAKCGFGYSRSVKCSTRKGKRVCRAVCKAICCGPKERKRLLCNKKACGCSAKATKQCGTDKKCRRKSIRKCRKSCNKCRSVCVRRQRCKQGQNEVRMCSKGKCRVRCVSRGCPVGTRRVKVCNKRTKRCRSVCRKKKTDITIKVKKDCATSKCECDKKAVARCSKKESSKRQSCVSRVMKRCRNRCRSRKVCKTVKKRACPKGLKAVNKCTRRGKALYCKVRCVRKCRPTERKVRVCNKKNQCASKCVSRCGKGFRKIRKCTLKKGLAGRTCKSVCVRRCPAGQRLRKGRCSKRRCRKGQRLVSKCAFVSRRCACRSRAISKCGMGLSRTSVRCRRRKMRRCKRKCKALSKTKKCRKVCITQKKKKLNCASRVLKKCGNKPTREGQKCRTRHLRRCKRTVRKCLCRARAVRRCGLGKSPVAKRCRSTYKRRCRRRCKRKANCRTVIRKSCKQHKRGSLKRKMCVRRVAKAKCGRKDKKKQNCNCRQLSVKKCGKGLTGKFVRCRDNVYEKCRRRCSTYTGKFCGIVNGKRTCYDYSCKGSTKGCRQEATAACSSASNKAKCISKKHRKCRSRKFKRCRKMRRRHIYSTKCNKKALVKCGPESSKAACRREMAKKCFKSYCKKYHVYKKHHRSCRRRTSIICSKSKGSAASKCRRVHRRRCVRRRLRRRYIQPPRCVHDCTTLCGGNSKGKCFRKQMDKCTKKWLTGYCERKSYYDCDADLPCMKYHIKKCTEKLPKCMNKKELCDDKDACTRDICHPTKGCLNIKKRCAKKTNKCIKSKCDPKKGCVYTSKNCDDKIACTEDSCDPISGKCKHKYIHKRCVSTDECKVGVCSKKGCTFAKNPTKTCKRIDPGKECEKKCRPSNACEQVKCVVSKDLKYKCVRRTKSCDDGLACTKDRCDPKLGCVRTFKKSAACKAPCARDLDCAQWGLDKKLDASCQVAVCDRNLGSCKAIDTKDKGTRCQKDDCPFKCAKKATKECGEFTRNFHTCEQVAVCKKRVNSTCIKECEKKASKKTKKVVVVVPDEKIVKKMKSKILAEKKTIKIAKNKISTEKSMKKVEKSAVKDAVVVEKKDKATLKKMKKDKSDKRDIKSMEKQVISDIKSKISHKNEYKMHKKSIKTIKKQVKQVKKQMKKDVKVMRAHETKTEKIQQDNKVEKSIDAKKSVIKAKKESSVAQNKKQETIRKEYKGETCTSNKDCGKSTFGSVCTAGTDGVKECRLHECNYDLHCNRNNKNKDTWGYCTKNKQSQRVCVFKKKCVKNSECDDFNSCTKDVCLSEYGYCKNIKRCDDGDACTVDVCTPCGDDNKSYKCSNTKKSCTEIKELLSQQLFNVVKKDQSKWLGKCSKEFGCRTCVVHAQCDDNNGCTTDSCVNQRCVHVPIHNEWCDPKIETQPITFQSIEDLRNAANFDLSVGNQGAK